MNVVIIMVEDTTAGALGGFGNDIVRTPALDALAAEGVRFDRAYCQASGCNASRSSYLTGLRPDTTRVFGNRDRMDEGLPAKALTLPEFADSAGATTVGVGKVFHHAYMAQKALRAYDRLELGELPDAYSGVSSGYTPAVGEPLPPAPRFRFSADPATEAELVRLKEERDLTRAHVEAGSREWFASSHPFRLLHSELLGDSGRTEELMLDGQRSRLTSQILGDLARSNERFLLTLGFTTPHVPLVAPREYIDLYDPDTIPLPPAPPEDDRGVPPVARRFGRNFDLFHLVEPTPDRVRRAIAAYYGCVSFVDAQVRIVLDALTREGLDQNTAVLFFADHGFHLGEHGLWSKVTLFEQSTRVPLIVRVPGAAGNGTVCDGIVELVDVLPTLADWWNLETPVPFEGTSFAPLLDDPSRPWKQAAFSLCKINRQLLGRAVRTERYRYSEWAAGAGIELYDLANDPFEQTNLAVDAAMRGVVADHAQLLRAGWREAKPPAAT